MALLRRDEGEEEGALQMTSFMDLVFLLVVFFIVTASLKKPQKVLPVEMPRATHARDMRLHREVVITVTQEGDRYLHDDKKHFNQAPVGRGEMMEFLRSVAEENRDTPIRLDIDRRAPYFQIMDVVDNLELYGLRKVYMRSKHGFADEKE
jgi:biopolymer transport protein ExbD